MSPRESCLTGIFTLTVIVAFTAKNFPYRCLPLYRMFRFAEMLGKVASRVRRDGLLAVPGSAVTRSRSFGVTDRGGQQ